MSSLGASGADAFVERASLLHAPGLSVKGLSKSFERRQVLSDVSLDVRPGEIVGLLGPNGAGKTLCFYSVIGLLRPDAGQVFVNGSDVSRLPMDRRGALGLCYLPQEPSVFRGLTVAENISAVIELREPKRLRQNRLDALIREFGLETVRDLAGSALSGGERRRCEIARAMAARPSVILLDEPFAHVDPLSIAELRIAVAEMKRGGVAVLITDHNANEILELVDRAYVIVNGRLLTHGTPADIVANADARRLYLGERFHLVDRDAGADATLSLPSHDITDTVILPG